MSTSVVPLCSPPVRAAALEGYVRICLAQYLLLAEKQKRLAADPNNRTSAGSLLFLVLIYNIVKKTVSQAKSSEVK